MILKKPTSLYLAFLFFILLYISGAIFPAYFNFGAPNRTEVPIEETGFMRVFSWCMIISMLVIVVKNTEIYVQSFKESMIGWIVLAYVLVSCLWSLHPLAALKNWEMYMMAFCFGILLARTLWPSQLVVLLGMLFGAIIIVGWDLVLFKPWIGIDSAGEWRGAYEDKNEMAFFMNFALSTLITLWGAKKDIFWRYCITLPLMALTFFLIYFSDSATGKICFVVLMMTCVMRTYIRGRISMMAITTPLILLIFAILTYAISAHTPEILQMLGKDESLTGRTEIWKNVLEVCKDHPWIGYGAETVYVRGGEVTTYTFSEPGLDDPVYARAPHNLYLALLLKYGAIGCFLFFLMYAQMMIRALKENHLNTHTLSGWYILIISIILVFGGSLNIDYMPMVWLLYGIILYAPTTWKTTYTLERVYT